jgi:magnesium chelatase family protein
MLARILAAAIHGIEAIPIAVEVDMAGGLPALNVVGLPDAAVRESRDRVRSAIQNSGFSFPARRITVNLAPGHLKKQGTGLDLPVAVGILITSGVVPAGAAEGLLLAGELSLDGGLRGVHGALSLAIAAKHHGCRGIVLPQASAIEASAVDGIAVFPGRSLLEVVAFLRGESEIAALPPLPEGTPAEGAEETDDFAEVSGQAAARRALEIAAAGGHNVLLVGPPGAGKTMLARRMPGILPPLDREEAVEITRIHSAAGLGAPQGLIRRRPFRAPHHSISGVGLAGGGMTPRPGEVSLAHRGVLFLDELPEFRRGTLEVLRQPMEEGRVVIMRSMRAMIFPARFVLVAAMNPCPCGQLGNPGRDCSCTPIAVRHYTARISGPLLDRFDIHLEVPRVPVKDLEAEAAGERSAVIRARVEEARLRQRQRLRRHGVRTNAEMSPAVLRDACRPDGAGRRLLSAATERLRLSVRAHHRILKVARTLADLEGEERILVAHLAEAIQYRSLDAGSSFLEGDSQGEGAVRRGGS